jgi:hypothetical protein
MRISALVDLLFYCSVFNGAGKRWRQSQSQRGCSGGENASGGAGAGERGGHWWSTAWRAREEKRGLVAALKAAGRHGLSLHLRLDRVRSVLPCEKNEHGAYSSGLPSSWPNRSDRADFPALGDKNKRTTASCCAADVTRRRLPAL